MPSTQSPIFLEVFSVLSAMSSAYPAVALRLRSALAAFSFTTSFADCMRLSTSAIAGSNGCWLPGPFGSSGIYLALRFLFGFRCCVVQGRYRLVLDDLHVVLELLASAVDKARLDFGHDRAARELLLEPILDVLGMVHDDLPQDFHKLLAPAHEDV